MVVFIYDLHLKGLAKAPVLSVSEYLGPAIIQAGLFDLEGLPIIKEEGNIVVGDLYNVTKETLHFLDKENFLLSREKVKAIKFSDGKMVNVFSYFFKNKCSKKII